MPDSKDEQLAKDSWLFSYYCNGMNLSVILRLEAGKIQGDSFLFSRKKTEGTRSDTIVVVVRDKVKEMIDRYKGQYMFNIFKESDSKKDRVKKTGYFTK